jgi:hypothetical protein
VDLEATFERLTGEDVCQQLRDAQRRTSLRTSNGAWRGSADQRSRLIGVS